MEKKKRLSYKSLYLKQRRKADHLEHEVDTSKIIIKNIKDYLEDGYKAATIPRITYDCWHINMNTEPSTMLCDQMGSLFSLLKSKYEGVIWI